MEQAVEDAVELHTESWPALGTTALLRHTGPAQPDIRAAVEAQLHAIDLAASRFRDDSELSRLNAAQGARTAVSPLLADAVTLALRAAEITGGAVDPTLGESLRTAGYDRDWRELQAIPAGAPLHAGDRIVVQRRRRRLWREIVVSHSPPELTVPVGVTLDLGATAKALAADRCAAAAHAAGAPGVLVSLGGDIATAGAPPRHGWQIHVTDDHRAGPDAEGQTIAIQDGGLATSSITTRRWLHGGQEMHHILDPRDGGPVMTPWRTVSVAAGTCADANIASTAAIVLGEEGRGWLEARGLPARLVARDGAVTTLGGWPS